MSKTDEEKDRYITIDQYLNGNPQTRIKQIQFFAYGSNSQKSILDMGQDFISYSQYQKEIPINSSTVLNSKDCLVYADRNNKKISIKQVGQHQQPVLTFAYTINEIKFDTRYTYKMELVLAFIRLSKLNMV
jgi:hypothetical protein